MCTQYPRSYSYYRNSGALQTKLDLYHYPGVIVTTETVGYWYTSSLCVPGPQELSVITDNSGALGTKLDVYTVPQEL